MKSYKNKRVQPFLLAAIPPGSSTANQSEPAHYPPTASQGMDEYSMSQLATFQRWQEYLSPAILAEDDYSSLRHPPVRPHPPPPSSSGRHPMARRYPTPLEPVQPGRRPSRIKRARQPPAPRPNQLSPRPRSSHHTPGKMRRRNIHPSVISGFPRPHPLSLGNSSLSGRFQTA